MKGAYFTYCEITIVWTILAIIYQKILIEYAFRGE